MTADAQFTHAHMVRFGRTIDAGPEAIWAVLTDTDRLPGWYGNGRIEGRVGGDKLSLTHLVDAAARGVAVAPQETYMKRNAERYGVDLSKRPG
jgi:uncharacterized protein YndB with AHSA1/START domain